MLAAIEFDDQAGFVTNKIRNVAPERHLTAEPKSPDFVVIAASATALSRLGSSPGAGLARARVRRRLDTLSFAVPRTGAVTPTQPSPIKGEGFEHRRCAARILGHHDAKTRIPYANLRNVAPALVRRTAS